MQKLERLDGRVLHVSGIVAAVLYSNFLIDWVLRGFEGFDVVVSNLEAPGQRFAVLLRVTDVVCGLLVLVITPAFLVTFESPRLRRVAGWSILVFVLGSIAAAVVATPCAQGVECNAPGQILARDIHDGTSIAAELGIFVSAAATWFDTRHRGPRWLSQSAWWSFWIGGVVLNIAFVWYGERGDAMVATAGYIQRAHILVVSFWILCLALRAASPGPMSHDTPSDQPSERGHP